MGYWPIIKLYAGAKILSNVTFLKNLDLVGQIVSGLPVLNERSSNFFHVSIELIHLGRVRYSNLFSLQYRILRFKT